MTFTSYAAPLSDIRFLLEYITPLDQLTDLPAFAHVDHETTWSLLEGAARFVSDRIAPTSRLSDMVGVELRDGSVHLPPAIRALYNDFAAAGWAFLQHPEKFGGGGFPTLVANAVREMVISGNLAFSMGPFLNADAASLINRHGSSAQRDLFMPPLVAGEWAATMAMTEAEAGSDLANIQTRAVPDGDGYRIFGDKLFVSWGDHDLTEQIIHLVLARIEGAPAGTRGLSLFLVPKFVQDDSGNPGSRNDIEVVGVERKVGIHGSPTCTLAFGGGGQGATAQLIGDPHDGLRQMFSMMNDARVGVGLQGVGVAERACQQALAYAGIRQQGHSGKPGSTEPTPIYDHPDIRRLVLTMRASIHAMRSMAYRNALHLDLAAHHPSMKVAARHRSRADLLTPITKAWCSDRAVTLTSDAIQVHGGLGYVEESGISQHWRDVRVTPIYEGTNGIQAIDLIERKVRSDKGLAAGQLLEEIRTASSRLPDQLAPVAISLRSSLEAVAESTTWMVSDRTPRRDRLAGASDYLSAFGTLLGAHELALAADLALDPQTRLDDESRRTRIAFAHVFAARVLPQAVAAAESARAGSDDLFGHTP